MFTWFIHIQPICRNLVAKVVLPAAQARQPLQLLVLVYDLEGQGTMFVAIPAPGRPNSTTILCGRCCGCGGTAERAGWPFARASARRLLVSAVCADMSRALL